jgi:hypothetical protein
LITYSNEIISSISLLGYNSKNFAPSYQHMGQPSNTHLDPDNCNSWSYSSTFFKTLGNSTEKHSVIRAPTPA